MKTGFIGKFILPRSVDFVAALGQQTGITRQIVCDLHEACVDQRAEAFDSIRQHADRARQLKGENMEQLLNVFLTPYDRESIYRLLTQLDWIVLSVKHFVIEREVYGIESLADYRDIFELLGEMAGLLQEGFDQFAAREMIALAASTDRVHDKYDLVVEHCARATAALFDTGDCVNILRHRDVVAQLKEIAKRIHVTANILEDMAIKTV